MRMGDIPDDARYRSPTGVNIYYRGPSKKGDYTPRPQGGKTAALILLLFAFVMFFGLAGGGVP